MKLVDVQHLVKQFSTAVGTVTAVDDVSFSVSTGEVFGLLGANGAGKTTTLRMILGLLQPTSGTATVGGCCVTEQPDEVKRNVALVSASSGLYQWLTPRELIQYFADVYGVPDEVAQPRIEHLIDLFDLKSFCDRRCAGLSTGQQQRVNLARSLVHDPPVIMMDEPTRGLDIVGSKCIFDFTAHLQQQGKAVVICTHHLDEAQRLCSRFGLMHQGRLQLHGTLPELQEATGLPHLTDMLLRLMAG
ncbi:MAG: ATP-binding cassette domain-containing protein [Planctomycetaceae bacterium]|nr:ATP-binding cassette domain-containing protein [Planctomycetaceae bacterium]